MKNFLVFFFCMISSSIIGSQLTPVIDSSHDYLEWPRNWRNTKTACCEKEEVNWEGFADLQVSGSAQFHEKAFVNMVQEFSDVRLLVLDMRQESHLLVNGTAVSWTDGPLNGGNKGMSLHQVIRDELKRIEDIIQEGIVQTNPPLQVERIQTERELVESLGHRYLRLPITDRSRPSDEIVDEIIAILKNLEADEWIHVHCKAGKGRTTTFMTIYDMMKNAQKVSFDDILLRQKVIGGSDFFACEGKSVEHLKKERLEFLTSFYQYCQEVPEFDQTWSQWISRELMVVDAELPI